jgi:hypothetical protein
MGAYYGGSAFLNNTGAAGASTVLNETQQLEGAWQSYLSNNNNTPPTDLGQLTGTMGNGPQYLANIPNWPAAAGNVTAAPIVVALYAPPNAESHYYALADVGAETTPGTGSMTDPNATACIKIIKAATGGQGSGLGNEYGDPNTIVSGGDGNGDGIYGNGTFGCLPMIGFNYTFPLPTNGIQNVVPPAHHYIMAYKLS